MIQAKLLASALPMHSEEISNIADKIVFSFTNKHLTDLQTNLLKASCKNTTYEEFAESCGYNVDYIKKDIGSELWKLLSQAVGEKVSKKNFRQALERYQQNHTVLQIQKTQKLKDWGAAPDASLFFGREKELTTLKQWIVKDRCRLIGIVGINGVGKTHLSVKLAEGIQDEFDYLIWRSLRNAPPFEEILSDYLFLLSNQQDSELKKGINARLRQLIAYLRQNRSLLILDNVESILQTAGYREGYEEYGELFRQIGECSHNSCLLFTSREKPKNIQRFNKIKPVRFLELRGLDYVEGRKIFNAIGDFYASEEEWKAIIEFYDGNPLALELAAHHINEVFCGNISRFLVYGKQVFGDIHELLDWHFQRLSGNEQEVMFWLAINTEAITLSELTEDILSEDAKEQVVITLQSLKNKIPLEISQIQGEESFGLQPVLIEYTINQLIEHICSEIKSGKISLLNQYALLKASAKCYERETQVRLIVKPIIQKLIDKFENKNNLIIQLNKIISKLKTEFYLKPGYATGNIINLLCHLKANLQGYDFSYLTVWQAYLQGISLHQVNFAGSSIAKSTFTQTFGGVHSIAFSPDGQFFAIADSNAQLRLFRAKDNQQLRLFQVQENHMWIPSVVFSADGKHLISGGFDQKVKIWDIDTGKCFKILSGHTKWIWKVTLSPDGKTIASAGDDCTIRLWDFATGECLKVLREHTNWVWGLAFSPNGKTIVSGSYDNTIKVWNISTGECLKTLLGHKNSVWSVDFSPNGKNIVSGSSDCMIKLWDVITGKCIQTFLGHKQEIREVTFSPDGKTIASGSFDKTIKIWDIKTGKSIKTLQGHNDWLRTVTFSPDGKQIASGDNDQNLIIWDKNKGDRLKNFLGYSNCIWSVASSPDSEKLVCGCLDSTVRIWNILTGECEKIIQEHKKWVWTVAWSPNGKIIASGSDDETIKLWDVSTGNSKTLYGHTHGGVWSIAFNPDSQYLVSGGQDGILKIWDALTGECLQTINAHSNWIWSVVWSPDGKTIASGSDDQTIKLWNFQNGQCKYIQTLQKNNGKVMSLGFSPDNSKLICGTDDKRVIVWDIATVKSEELHKHIDNLVLSVAYSHDGQYIASSSNDKTIIVRNLNTNTSKILKGHTSWVRSIAWSPNNKYLMSGCKDETIKLWHIYTGECLKTLKILKPYQDMNIMGIKGLTKAEKQNLVYLGAVNSETRM